MTQPYRELRDLAIGQRFMLYADDLERRGPFTLVEKNMGTAKINHEPTNRTRTFTARDRNGQPVERTITTIDSGAEICSLGTQVVVLP